MNQVDTELLLLACSYHDIGRVNDYRDPEHGLRAANILADMMVELDLDQEKLLMIQTAVSVHSTEDERLDDFLDMFHPRDLSRTRILCSALKDADNLDRVRIGDLNSDYLRFDVSKRLVDLAKDLLQVTLACSFGLPAEYAIQIKRAGKPA